jgi:nucleotide-binding universal stress UspA family protein
MTEGPDELRAIVARLDVLGGGHEVLRRAAARLLGSMDPPRATELLSGVMRLSVERWEPAMRVLPAFMRALEEDGDLIPHLASLRQVAALHEQEEVTFVFTEGEAVMEYHADAAARADAKLFTLPLGVLKSRARLTRNPDELSRLAVASNPDVIREVLKNPRLTEDLVVRIAARRPARPEPLVEIWRSHRWNNRPAIRKALVFNPYLPPETGAKIVPLLGLIDLKALAVDTKVHLSIRELAAKLSASSSR